MMLHPNAERLLQFADGVTPESEHARLTSHLADCARCRAEVSGTREVQELLVVALEPAPETLLARVYDSRALNALVMLPVGVTAQLGEKPNRRLFVLMGLGAAAIALVALLPGGGSFDLQNGNRAARAVALPQSTIELFPAAGPLDPTRVHPVDLWYTRTVSKSDGPEEPATEMLHYRIEAMSPDEHAWRIISDRGTRPFATRDTLVLDATTLEPRRFIHNLNYNSSVGEKIDRSEYSLAGLSMNYSRQTRWTPREGADGPILARENHTYQLRANVDGPKFLGQANLLVITMALHHSIRSRALRFASIIASDKPRLVAEDWMLVRAQLSADSTSFTYLRMAGSDSTWYTIRGSDGLITRIRAMSGPMGSPGASSAATIEISLASINGKPYWAPPGLETR